jgi:membrane-associated phospholipid phosphatase
MNKDVSEPVPETPVKPSIASFWVAHRRRPLFLLLLIIGLGIFLYWLPAGALMSLWLLFSAQRGLAILLFLFAMVTLSLVWSGGQRLDSWIFLFFNLYTYPKWVDSFMWLATQFGNMLAAFVVAFLFFLLDYRRLAIEIIFGTLTLWLLVEIIKALTERKRPFLTIENARVIGWRETGESFPSGHTSQTFFLTTLIVLCFSFGPVINVTLYAVAVLVGFTRIYVGAHYPRDVFGGAVLGSIWGILSAFMDPSWWAK